MNDGGRSYEPHMVACSGPVGNVVAALLVVAPFLIVHTLVKAIPALGEEAEYGQMA